MVKHLKMHTKTCNRHTVHVYVDTINFGFWKTKDKMHSAKCKLYQDYILSISGLNHNT